jgi:hypothetical protein
LLVGGTDINAEPVVFKGVVECEDSLNDKVVVLSFALDELQSEIRRPVAPSHTWYIVTSLVLCFSATTIQRPLLQHCLGLYPLIGIGVVSNI